MNHDLRWMHYALSLARRGLGRTGANPSVGCVIIKNGVVLAASRTADGGRPHAEHQALSAVKGMALQEATAYVTLEPCAHDGKTPSCARLLMEAGIGRVVIAAQDPDSRTNGEGIKMLSSKGISVELGLCENIARDILSGFFLRHNQMRPHVTLKLASTLDGAIATASGESQWITGEPARHMGHWLRASHDAIMVGSGTWKTDKPRLDCRIEGLQSHSPVVVLLDRDGELDADHPALACKSYVITSPENHLRLQKTLPEHVECLAVEGRDVGHVLTLLAEKGIQRLFVEGGAQLAASLLQKDYVDECWWFSAPSILGGDAKHAVAALGHAALSEMHQWRVISEGNAGRDRWIQLVRQRESG